MIFSWGADGLQEGAIGDVDTSTAVPSYTLKI